MEAWRVTFAAAEPASNIPFPSSATVPIEIELPGSAGNKAGWVEGRRRRPEPEAHLLSEVPCPQEPVDTSGFLQFSGQLPTGPRRNMLVSQVFPDQVEIGRVVRDERCPGFPA